MSNIILPGDPPPAAFRNQIALLQRELVGARRQAEHLIITLVEVVRQLGVEDVLVLDRPSPKEGEFKLMMRPTENGGMRLSLQSEQEEVEAPDPPHIQGIQS